MISAGNTFTLEHAEVSNPPLFVALPDTDFRNYLNEITSFAESHPDVVASVEADQDRLSRRGIDAARSELTGKVLAYNFCRKIEIRKRQAEQLRLAG